MAEFIAELVFRLIPLGWVGLFARSSRKSAILWQRIGVGLFLIGILYCGVGLTLVFQPARADWGGAAIVVAKLATVIAGIIGLVVGLTEPPSPPSTPLEE